MVEDNDHGFDEATEREWREYINHFASNIYPMFKEKKVSFDAALIVWFVNRLRNAMPDDDVGNNPWG